MTERDAIIQTISRLQDDLAGLDASAQREIPGLDRFILLLGGISTYRKAPGIDGPMGFDRLYHCSNPEEAQQVRGHLEETFGITDRDSLLNCSDSLFSCGAEYAQFLTFWGGDPVFDEEELEPGGKEAFQACKDYANLFRPFVGDQGFYAWDISERIGLARLACACGLIDDREFRALGWELARLACDIYTSWEEYALGCLCGSVYFMFVQNGRQEDNLKAFCDINEQCLRSLFFDDGFWSREGWYVFPEKVMAIPPEQLEPLLADWDGPAACLVTDRILVEGLPVGYMYREEPEHPESADSGWRFFAGDEDEEYLSNPEYSGISDLNTLCNYSKDILPLLNAPYGTAFSREDGVLKKETEV